MRGKELLCKRFGPSHTSGSAGHAVCVLARDWGLIPLPFQVIILMTLFLHNGLALGLLIGLSYMNE